MVLAQEGQERKTEVEEEEEQEEDIVPNVGSNGRATMLEHQHQQQQEEEEDLFPSSSAVNQLDYSSVASFHPSSTFSSPSSSPEASHNRRCGSSSYRHLHDIQTYRQHKHQHQHKHQQLQQQQHQHQPERKSSHPHHDEKAELAMLERQIINEVSSSRLTPPFSPSFSTSRPPTTTSRDVKRRSPPPIHSYSSSTTAPFQNNGTSTSRYDYDVHPYHHHHHHHYESAIAAAAVPAADDECVEEKDNFRPPFHLGGAEAEDLLQWLEEKGVILQQPERLLLSSSYHQDCPEFSDGLLLARLVYGREATEPDD
eukprot:evm.model.NODE_10435_length_7355_cov_31.723318.2